MWRRLRIIALLVILAVVALNAYFDRVYSTDWNMPLRVAVYTINGDGSDEADRFLQKIGSDDFIALEGFFAEQASGYGVALEKPVQFTLAGRLRELPPSLDRRSSLPTRVLWSLRTRWWAWRTSDPPGPTPD